MRELDLDWLRERLSPKAMTVLSFSIEESRHRNHNFLSGDHILLSLCKIEPELVDFVLCCDKLFLDQLTSETKTLLDQTQPHVGRSLKMTPELRRTFRIAWENIHEKNRQQIETFDLLEALLKNGTSKVWQMIQLNGSGEEQIHANLETYAKTYLAKKLIEPIDSKEFEARLPQMDKKVRRALPVTPISLFLRACSFALTFALFALFVLAVIRC